MELIVSCKRNLELGITSVWFESARFFLEAILIGDKVTYMGENVICGKDSRRKGC